MFKTLKKRSVPKVSVILTSYNHEKYIREAIESVLNQTFTDFELIVWDDGSTDKSWEIINSYQDVRIKSFRNETNQRYVINRAIKEVASGEYIAIHHSDDIWEPDKLKKQIEYLENHLDIGAVFSNALIINENGEFFEDHNNHYCNIFDQPNRTRHQWLNYFFYKGNCLCHPSILIRKQCYQECGLYTCGLAQLADFDMWIRLCFKYEIYVFPDKLVRFRVRDNECNASGMSVENEIRSHYEYYKILNNYLGIKNLSELEKIFPITSKYKDILKPDLHFILAMMALEKDVLVFHRLFALDLIYQIITDPIRSKNVLLQHNFGYMDFITLAGNQNCFQIQSNPIFQNSISSIIKSILKRFYFKMKNFAELIIKK